MPFIVDLPPKDLTELKTNIEHYIDDTNRSISGIDSENVYKLDTDMFENVYLREKFNSLVKEWDANTILEHSISKIIEDTNFKEIVKMGKKGVPLIIDKIDDEPSVLVWALNIITNQSLDNGPMRMTISELCKKWVKYYKKGLIQNL